MLKIDAYFNLPKSISMVLLLLIAGCTPVISKQIREQIRPDITFKDVLHDPERYQGQMVMVSGIIIETESTKEGTLLKILQSPATVRGEPKDVDKSEGRILALDNRYLDKTLYTKGRSVTIAGDVLGKRVLPLGETVYQYPLIQVKELYLWPIIRRHHPYSYYSFNRYYWWRSSLLHQRRVPKRSR